LSEQANLAAADAPLLYFFKKAHRSFRVWLRVVGTEEPRTLSPKVPRVKTPVIERPFFDSAGKEKINFHIDYI
jgi:hypothetical protein